MKKVCVFTGTRAEFGLLLPLLEKLKLSSEFELQLVALAMHLSPEFGLTYKEIEEQGFTINKKIETILSSDTASSISKSIGLAQIGIADALTDLNPDIAIILGDRTEMLAAAICCSISSIPIAHIHGGEVTAGAYDDAIRHSISKMSYWHFTSTEKYKRRVIQLGEDPGRVFNVGAIALDSITKLPLLSKLEFEESINFKLHSRNILITYHPVTLGNQKAQSQIETILEALKESPADTGFIFTHANSDKNGRVINKKIDDFVYNFPDRSVSFKSLGQLRYLSALQHVDVVLGNSSSGIIEVPFFNIPTINIGDRQSGRITSNSIINISLEKIAIKKAIQKALTKDSIKNQISIYGNGTTSEQIINVLKNQDIDSKHLIKGFYDLN